ncbi:recombinase family protein [Chloroflexota bacterium]
MKLDESTKSRVVIYSRVSTDEQDIDNQVKALEQYIVSRCFIGIRTYRETESAWKGGRQSELKRLCDDASRRQFNIVLVWSLDRLSREGSLAILQLINRLNRYGVKVISLQEPWTEAPGELGEVLYSLAGWVARMESQRRSERTKAGLARVKAGGKKLGRPIGSKDQRQRKARRYASL